MFKQIITISFFYLVSVSGFGQLSGELAISTGNSYVSNGQYAKQFSQLSYQSEQWHYSVAAGIVFSSARENNFDALRLTVAKDLEIKNKPYKANIFYQRSPYSSRLNEHMGGILFTRETNRWYFNLGVNTRLYQLKHRYAKENAYAAKNLWEPVNVMYRITYHRPLGNTLEINASVTNFDHLIIEQETNPFLMMGLQKRVAKKSKVYLDIAYQQAGFFNIRVNYFGYYVKAGYLFDITFSGKTDRQLYKPKP